MNTAFRFALLIPLFVVATARSAAPAAAAEKAIVVQSFYYALPGKADEVYRWRLHASECGRD